MIPPIQAAVSPWPDHIWQQSLQSAYRTYTQLLTALDLAPPTTAVDNEAVHRADSGFPTLVPASFAARMRKGDPRDPLLLQVLPVASENENVAGFSNDPLAETSRFAANPGLIHKYHGRALLIATGACAVHCRYCFRRHFPYQEHRPRDRDQAIRALRADTSISEIILSGGDPWLLTDAAFGSLVEALSALQHLKRLRVHTRLPIVIPERITQKLLDILLSTRLKCTIVIHTNHPNELNQDTLRAMNNLRQHGLWVLNQTVLLRGVNDDAAIQVELAESLHEQGVLPYYLHLPDRVRGTHHFFVNDADGLSIYSEMRRRLPGYLLPRLVREEPGESAKTLVV